MHGELRGDTRRSGGDFLNFLLIAAGLSCLVVAHVILPRIGHREQLEARRDRLQSTVDHYLREAADYRRRHVAFRDDPHYRRAVLRWATKHRLPGEQTVEEYVLNPDGRGVRGGTPLQP